MSTTLPDSQTVAKLEPVSHADLIDSFHRGGKPKTHWRVGSEFEAFVVDRTTGRAISYAEPGGIRDLLQALVDRFGWTPHFRGERLTMLSRGGATVSLEPGGQVEFSSPPVANIAELEAEYNRYRNEVKTVLDPRFAMIAAGVTPFATIEEIPPPVRRRHQLMAQYLPARCSTAVHMMQATASTQSTFDYADEADAIRKFTTALKLGPVINAIWGNSPLYGGELTGWVSYRGKVWLGMDAQRCGLLPELLSAGFNFERWTEFLLEVPLLFAVRDGQYIQADGQTFRQYMAHGIAGHFPTIADWEVHISTVFPEVRLKQFLEVRGADANPPPLNLAVPTFWKGLLYDADALAEAEAVASDFAPAELPKLFEVAARDGLSASWGGQSLLSWARRLTEISVAGLQPVERGYLDPVQEILARGTSPGALLMKETPHTVESVLKRLDAETIE
jgi:glutamate--cysteine ligase